MLKSRRVVIVALLLGVCVAGGALLWLFAGPFGPARKVVGEWDIMGSDFEEAVKDALEKKEVEGAGAIAEKFRSNQRLSFSRNGICRYVQELLGLTITAEGTYRVTANADGTLVVAFHKKRLTVHNSQKGETQEKDQDAVVEWVVTVVEPDQLSVATNEKGNVRRSP